MYKISQMFPQEDGRRIRSLGITTWLLANPEIDPSGLSKIRKRNDDEVTQGGVSINHYLVKAVAR